MMLAIRLLVTGFLADLLMYISFNSLDAVAIVFHNFILVNNYVKVVIYLQCL